MNRPRIGVAMIIRKQDRVLLGKRKNAHGDGTWAFPGGHLEYGESIEACARREVMEECGIEIQNLSFGPFTNDIFEVENKHYITLFVLAEVASGEPTVKEPDKCDAWEWVDWETMPQPLFLPIRNLKKQAFHPFSA
ncbi:MAG: NUDIX domain-containing protein [Desulfobacteraceae bacterium]|nr:NUDIX domain-containing protein [Desulfobacteraceae bacterium]